MDLMARKLNLIEEFIKINDEKIISRFEAVLRAEDRKDLKPMTLDEFYAMIDQSVEESKKGQVTSHEKLLEEIKSW